MQDLGSCAARRKGSSPLFRTQIYDRLSCVMTVYFFVQKPLFYKGFKHTHCLSYSVKGNKHIKKDHTLCDTESENAIRISHCRYR